MASAFAHLVRGKPITSDRIQHANHLQGPANKLVIRGTFWRHISNLSAGGSEDRLRPASLEPTRNTKLEKSSSGHDQQRGQRTGRTSLLPLITFRVQEEHNSEDFEVTI